MLKTPPLIIINDNLVDQIRFPKSKKSRIRKKWKKRSSNFRPSYSILRVNGKFICHSIAYNKLLIELNKSCYIVPPPILCG